jgi:Tol biopolymer transport system component
MNQRFGLSGRTTLLSLASFVLAVAFTKEAAQEFAVTGYVTAPPGTVVTLKERSGQTVTVTVPADRRPRLATESFSFPQKLPDGTVYVVTIEQAPDNLVCSVIKNGNGAVSGGSPVVYVACDIAADLASRSSDDQKFGTFYDSTAPVIGGIGADDGRYVAYVSYAAGLDGSTGRKRQIFWRDRHMGVTKLVSSSSISGEANGDCGAPAISADGRSVAFESYATNLVPIDTNNVRDVFVWNADTNLITAVSDAPGGVEANAEAFEPSISADGSKVAFTSSASNLTSGVDGTSQTNVFLKDMTSGSVTLISRSEATQMGAGGNRPSISEDGSRIAFCSFAPLAVSDKNGLWDIYLWESGRPLKRLSLTSNQTEREQGDESASRIVAPEISGNGKLVTYATTAGNVVPYDNNKKQDVFIVDADTGRVSRMSLNNDAMEGDADSPIGQGERIGVSYDGRWVAFTTGSKLFGGGIIMKNFVTGEARVVTTAAGGNVGRPDISREGGYVIFGCGEKLDPRFPSSGIFVRFAGGGR